MNTPLDTTSVAERSKALIYLSWSAGRGFESYWRHIFSF